MAGDDTLLNGFGDPAAIGRIRAEMAKEFGVRVARSPADIIKSEQIAAMVAQAKRELGSLDILVNNAGVLKSLATEAGPHAAAAAVVNLSLPDHCHLRRPAGRSPDRRELWRRPATDRMVTTLCRD